MEKFSEDPRVDSLLVDKAEGELLVRLREELVAGGHSLHPSAHSDLGLLHFLRSRDNNLKDAYEMVVEDMIWREENDVDNIEKIAKRSPYFEPLESYMPFKYHGNALDNRLVLYYCVGNFDISGVFTKIPADALIAWMIYFYEAYRTALYSQEDPQACYNAVVVGDVKGVGWSLIYSLTSNRARFAEITAIAERHYPETMAATYVVNAPSVFKKMWKTISPFLDPTTVQKIHILGAKDYPSVLQGVVDKASIPAIYGGECECQGKGVPCIPQGGSFAPSPEDVEFVEIKRAGGVHQHELEVSSSGDVIAWDFHTEKRSVRFAVVYNGKELVQMDKVNSHMGTISGTLVARETGTYTLVWDNSTSRLHQKRLYYRCSVYDSACVGSE